MLCYAMLCLCSSERRSQDGVLRQVPPAAPEGQNSRTLVPPAAHNRLYNWATRAPGMSPPLSSLLSPRPSSQADQSSKRSSKHCKLLQRESSKHCKRLESRTRAARTPRGARASRAASQGGTTAARVSRQRALAHACSFAGALRAPAQRLEVRNHLKRGWDEKN